MKKFISAFLAISIFISSIPCFAEEQNKEPGVSSAKLSEVVKSALPESTGAEKDLTAISPLRKTQLAPFTGVLLSPLAIATIISEIKFQQDKIDIEVKKAVETTTANFQYEQKIFQNQCTADKSVLEASIKEKSKQIEIIDSLYKEEVNSRPNPVTWSLLGLAAGVVVTTATASIITAVSN